MQFILTFGWSSSPRYQRAAAIADTVPGSTIEGEGRTLLHHVPVGLNHLEEAAEILEAAKGWRSTTATVDGFRLSAGGLRDLIAVLTCYREYRVRGGSVLYCRGLPEWTAQSLPCRQAERHLYHVVHRAPQRRDDADELVTGLERGKGLALCPVFDRGPVVNALVEGRPYEPAARDRLAIEIEEPWEE